MSRAILIMGPSGSGKSHSIQFLPPSETAVINALNKDLPWKGSGKQYTVLNKNNPKGNLINTDDPYEIARVLKYLSDKRPDIKNIVLDDHTHIYVNYYLQQAAKEEVKIANNERPNIYLKFTHIAQFTKELADICKSLRDDICVYIMHHTDESDDVLNGVATKASSFGKFVEERLKGIESQFTVVLLAGKKADDQNKIKGYFKTQDVTSTAKSPMGMFEEAEIPNNLAVVRSAIECYYDGNC